MLVIRLNIVYFKGSLRSYINGETILSKTVVSLKKHRVKRCIRVSQFVELLNTSNALNIHILGNFDRVSTPRSNHCGARTNERAIKRRLVKLLGIAKEPFQFIEVRFSKGSLDSHHIKRVFRVFKEKKHLFQLIIIINSFKRLYLTSKITFCISDRRSLITFIKLGANVQNFFELRILRS